MKGIYKFVNDMLKLHGKSLKQKEYRLEISTKMRTSVILVFEDKTIRIDKSWILSKKENKEEIKEVIKYVVENIETNKRYSLNDLPKLLS